METIDIISFLRNYYGITHQNLSFQTLTHDDVSKLFPDVRVVTDEVLDEDIKSGNIILVYDKTNKILCYDNPHINIDKLDIEVETDNYGDKKIISLDNLDILSKDELLHLRRKLRLNNQRKESYIINNLIKKIKRREPKEYRKKKEKIIKEERMNYYD